MSFDSIIVLAGLAANLFINIWMLSQILEKLDRLIELAYESAVRDAHR